MFENCVQSLELPQEYWPGEARGHLEHQLFDDFEQFVKHPYEQFKAEVIKLLERAPMAPARLRQLTEMVWDGKQPLVELADEVSKHVEAIFADLPRDQRERMVVSYFLIALRHHERVAQVVGTQCSGVEHRNMNAVLGALAGYSASSLKQLPLFSASKSEKKKQKQTADEDAQSAGLLVCCEPDDQNGDDQNDDNDDDQEANEQDC
jgi:hypothetical protein